MKDAGERLSLRDAADALGISEVTARRWVKSGKLKAYQPGRKYLIPASAVEELLEEAEVPKVQASGPWRARLRALNKEKKRDLALAAKGVVGDTWLGATTTRELRALKAFTAEYGVSAEDVLEALIDDTPGLGETLDRLEERAHMRAEQLAEESREEVDATLERAATERGA